MELNKIHFKNCIEVLQSLPDNSIDMFLQDPPFEVTDQVWDKGFIENLPLLWDLWLNKGKRNAAFVFKATFPFAIDLINSNRKMVKYEWIWEKNSYTNFVNAKRMPLRNVEYLFVFYREQPTYNPVLRKNKHVKPAQIKKTQTQTKIYSIKEGSCVYKVDEFGQPTNLIKVNSEKDRFVSSNGSQNRHPNRTNPALWEYFIKTYTNEGDVVFDGYSGSGSVPEACIELNRKFIACENSDEYFYDTEKRLFDLKEKKLYGYDKTNIVTSPNSLFFGLTL